MTAAQAADLGNYAGQVFDYHLANPHLLRLMSWEALQSPEVGLAAKDERAAHYADKVSAVAAAQLSGEIASDPQAPFLFSAVMAITTWWFTSANIANLITAGTESDDAQSRREALVSMVRRLTAPPPVVGYDRSLR
nr:hypothetical protein [Lysinibacter cavernae]